MKSPRKRWPGVFVLVLALAGLGGCGTTMTTSGSIFYPYSGVDMDSWIIQHSSSSWERALRAIDIPFSMVADTALLPITIPARLYHDC